TPPGSERTPLTVALERLCEDSPIDLNDADLLAHELSGDRAHLLEKWNALGQIAASICDPSGIGWHVHQCEVTERQLLPAPKPVPAFRRAIARVVEQAGRELPGSDREHRDGDSSRRHRV